MNKLTLTVSEVSEAMGIGKNQAYELVKSEGFPCVYVGRRIVVPYEAFLNWLNSQNQKEN